VRWFASRPPWVLAVAWVLVLLCVVLGSVLTEPFLTYLAVMTVFFLFFGTLMALVSRRGTTQPRSPRPH
jgi:uncharacterized membrane protein